MLAVNGGWGERSNWFPEIYRSPDFPFCTPPCPMDPRGREGWPVLNNKFPANNKSATRLTGLQASVWTRGGSGRWNRFHCAGRQWRGRATSPRRALFSLRFNETRPTAAHPCIAVYFTDRFFFFFFFIYLPFSHFFIFLGSLVDLSEGGGKIHERF